MRAATIGYNRSIRRDEIVTVEHHPKWIHSRWPQAYTKRRIVAHHRTGAHYYGIALGALTVHKHLSERRRNSYRLMRAIGFGRSQESIGRLSPFELHIWPAMSVGIEETFIKASAFILEYAHLYLDTSITKHGNATSAHLGKWVDSTDNHPRYSRIDNQL